MAKDLLDLSVDYSNAAINRFHEGKVGAALANWYLGSAKISQWRSGLMTHVYGPKWGQIMQDYQDHESFGETRRPANFALGEEIQEAWVLLTDRTEVEVTGKLLKATGRDVPRKYRMALERSGAAIGFYHAIYRNVENAAGRSKRGFYKTFEEKMSIHPKHYEGMSDAQLKAELGKRAKAADAWLESAEPAAVFARAQIEKFKNGTTVASKWGDTVCRRCNGPGFIAAFAHVDGGVCYGCGGSGREPGFK